MLLQLAQLFAMSMQKTLYIHAVLHVAGAACCRSAGPLGNNSIFIEFS